MNMRKNTVYNIHTQDDSGGKVSILGGDTSGHFEIVLFWMVNDAELFESTTLTFLDFYLWN
jgi:hypothetical protein